MLQATRVPIFQCTKIYSYHAATDAATPSYLPNLFCIAYLFLSIHHRASVGSAPFSSPLVAQSGPRSSAVAVTGRHPGAPQPLAMASTRTVDAVPSFIASSATDPSALALTPTAAAVSSLAVSSLPRGSDASTAAPVPVRPRRFDFSGVSIASNEVQSFMQTKTEVQEADRYDFVVTGTGVIRVGDEFKASGAILLLDGSCKQLWAQKAVPFIGALVLIASHVPALAGLKALATSCTPVQKRKYEFGVNAGDTQKGSKGGEFDVNIVRFTVTLPGNVIDRADVPGQALDPVAHFDSLVEDLYEVITSDLFKNTYLQCMREDSRLVKLAKSIEKPGHPTWGIYRGCRLVKDYPKPLNRYLLDGDVKTAIAELTGKTDPSMWTPDERFLAYQNGVVPGASK